MRRRTTLNAINRRVSTLGNLVNGIIPFGKIRNDHTFSKHDLVIKISQRIHKCADDLVNNEKQSVGTALQDNLKDMKAHSSNSQSRMNDTLKLYFGLGKTDDSKAAKLMAYAKKLGIISEASSSDKLSTSNQSESVNSESNSSSSEEPKSNQNANNLNKN